MMADDSHPTKKGYRYLYTPILVKQLDEILQEELQSAAFFISYDLEQKEHFLSSFVFITNKKSPVQYFNNDEN